MAIPKRLSKCHSGQGHLILNFEDRYETVRVPERKLVTWGVDITKLDSWLEEQETGQARLPEVD